MNPESPSPDQAKPQPPSAHADHHRSAAHRREHVADPCGRQAALETLRHGPRGALVVASIAMGVVMLLWFCFFLFVFLPRGPVE